MKNTTISRHTFPDPPQLSGRQNEYLRHLGFQRNPFPVAPDVEHLFIHPRTDTLLTEILHGIYTRKGFIVITGEVGLGKTTLSQHILNILEEDGRVETALVLNTFLQGTELLGEIIRDFGIETSESTHQGQMMVLNHFLIERYRSGTNCAVIIDDAQNLSLESLELVRMISNLETDASKLIQILLVGQPEFQEKLDTHSLRQLKSRIMIHAKVEPLDKDALRQYVFFKMSAAGSGGGVSVPENCFDLIHKLTQGNPRLINRLMDRTLYGLFAYNTTQVSQQLLLEVAKEIGLSVPKAEWWQRSIRIAVAALAVIGLANILFAGKQWVFQKTETARAKNDQVENHQIKKPPPENHQAENRLAESRLAESRLAESRLAESRLAESRLAESRLAESQAGVRTGSSSVRNEERPPTVEQPLKSAILLEVRQFLEYYGLENYAEVFAEALAVGLGPVAQRIWEESGYRLVELPETVQGIKGNYRVLRYSVANSVGKRLLFWRPNYWIDSFTSGEKNEKVLAMQKQLAQVNFYHATPDGIVGNQTVTSLIGFQKRHNLFVSGQPDASTLFLLSQTAGELHWNIQIASLQRLEDALALVESLSRKGFRSFVEPLATGNGQAWQAVRVGPLNSYADAEAQRHEIMTKLNITGRIVQSQAIEQRTTSKG